MIAFHLLTFIFKFYENTSSQDVVCWFFFLSSISAVPQLFETCCDLTSLPPVMKITLIACLGTIQPETEYAATITNRWRLAFYVPQQFLMASFLVYYYYHYYFVARLSLKSCGHSSSTTPLRVRGKVCFLSNNIQQYLLNTCYILHTGLGVGETDVNFPEQVLPLWALDSSGGNRKWTCKQINMCSNFT